jgi:hypothetical protein
VSGGVGPPAGACIPAAHAREDGIEGHVGCTKRSKPNGDEGLSGIETVLGAPWVSNEYGRMPIEGGSRGRDNRPSGSTPGSSDTVGADCGSGACEKAGGADHVDGGTLPEGAPGKPRRKIGDSVGHSDAGILLGSKPSMSCGKIGRPQATALLTAGEISG